MTKCWDSKLRALRSAGLMASPALSLLLGSAPARAEEPTEIEVRGSPLSAPAKEPSVASSVIRRERLQAPGAQLTDVLRSEPSVSVSETGGYSAPSTASLRGATAAQTPVYLAGVRLNDEVGGAADLGAVPPWFLNRIEIYRSNAPLAGDTLGIGGAIFLEPRRPSGTEASVGGMLGSYGARALFGQLGLGDRKRGALLGVRYDGAQNDYAYTNDNGTRFDPSQEHRSVLQNADARRLELWGVGTTTLGEHGRADVVLNDSEREQGVPTLALFGSLSARARLTRRLGAVSTRVDCGPTCRVSTTSSALWTDARYTDPLSELGLGSTALELRGARVEHGLVLEKQLGHGFSVSPTLRASLERLLLAANNQPDLHAQRGTGRAALQAEWRASSSFTLRALGSAECHGTSVDRPVPWGAPGDVDPLNRRGACTELEPAGRAGATFDARYVELLTTLGHYSRVPTLSELYGTSGFVRGNTALTPERGISFELGARSGAPLSEALGGFAFDVFGFARQASDLISYQRSALGYIRPYNIGSARVLGLEALFAYSPKKWLQTGLSLTMTDPRDTSAARPIANILPHQARVVAAPRVELRSNHAGGTFNLATLSLCYLYQGQRYADRANLIAIPQQGSLDLEATVIAFGDHLATRARLSNLLDQTRFDLIGYPLPGRAAYVSAELRL